jgi:hypothetical protein
VSTPAARRRCGGRCSSRGGLPPPSRSGPGVNPHGPSVDRVRFIFYPPDVHAPSAFPGGFIRCGEPCPPRTSIGSPPHFFGSLSVRQTLHMCSIWSRHSEGPSLRLVPSRLRRVCSSKSEQPRRCKAAAALAKPVVRSTRPRSNLAAGGRMAIPCLLRLPWRARCF